MRKVRQCQHIAVAGAVAVGVYFVVIVQGDERADAVDFFCAIAVIAF